MFHIRMRRTQIIGFLIIRELKKKKKKKKKMEKMERMSICEKFELETDLNQVMNKKNLSSSERVMLQKLGLDCDNGGGYQNCGVTLDLDGFEDSTLWQLRRELRNLKGSTLSNKSGEQKESTLLSEENPASNDDDGDDDLRKSLRAAILKRRFAEIISKATNGGNPDPKRVLKGSKRVREETAKMRALKRQRMEAREALNLMEKKTAADVVDNFNVMRELEALMEGGREEAERIRALIETGQLKKREDELKQRRRDEARKAAREALILMEKNATANVVDNFKVMRELEALMEGGREEAEKFRALIKTEQLKKREDELKRRRHEERKAAREALKLVEKNAAANMADNFKVMKELEELMNGGDGGDDDHHVNWKFQRSKLWQPRMEMPNLNCSRSTTSNNPARKDNPKNPPLKRQRNRERGAEKVQRFDQTRGRRTEAAKKRGQKRELLF